MPYVRRLGVDIHYEVTRAADDRAPWLLLIPGLSANTRAFPALVRAFSASHHVLIFDPRGAGLTTPRVSRFALHEVALDAVAVLDAAAVASADVLGISMGGMISQELALSAPQRVSRLVLTCTSCGRRPGVRPSPVVIGRLLRGVSSSTGGGSVEQIAKRFSGVLFSPETPENRRIEFFRPRLDAAAGQLDGARPTLGGIASQLLAVRAFASHPRLSGVSQRALVIHGRDDVLLPPRNAEVLAAALPRAELSILPGGHVFFFEHHDAYVDRVRTFLGAAA